MHPIVTWSADAPLVIAHRGASLHAPENTLAAFRLAAELGADAIELDAMLTADGNVVVHHDRTLERTTDGVGRLTDCTLEELRRLDAGSYFNDEFVGEQIPTLQEVLQLVGERILINIELSNYASPLNALPERASKIVREFQLESRILFSSFNPIALVRASRLVEEVPLGLLVMPTQPSWLRWLFGWIASHSAYHPHWQIVDQQTVSRHHMAGRRVHVWTVNDPERITSLVNLGVDGVITDALDLALELMKQ